MDGMTPTANPHVYAHVPHKEVHHHYPEPYLEPHVYARRGRRRGRTHLEVDDEMYQHGDVVEHVIKTESEGMHGLEAMLLGMCQKQGIDPAIVAMMKDKEHDGMFGGGSGMLVLLFLIILLGGRGFGFGHDGRGEHHGGGWGGGFGGPGIVNQIDFKTLLDAIETQGTRKEIAMKELATNLHIDFEAVQKSLCCLDKGLALIEGKMGFIDADLKNSIERCCCNMRLETERVGNMLQKDIFCLKSDMDKQFCEVKREMQAGFCRTDALIVQVNNDNRFRELEEEKRRLETLVFQNSQNAQTDRILHAIKCEPRRVCFDERPDDDRRDRR